MKLGAPPLPTEPSAQEVADWAELVALRVGKISRGKLTTELARNGEPERLVADAWDELNERVELCEPSPFAITDTQLERLSAERSPQHILPAFFAALGLRENIENVHRALFEQCVTELVRGLLPNSLRIGHPRRPPVQQSFRDALAAYAKEVDEEIVKTPPGSDNDLKMDILAWRRFQDGRGGYLHLVGQCATGADWDSKLDELNLEVVKDHICWGVDPLRFFATPHVVTRQHFRRVSRRAGLVLDRPRLLELSRARPLTPETEREVSDVLGDLY